MIHVVYTIYKKDSKEPYDIIAQSSETYITAIGSTLGVGGRMDSLRNIYPESEYDISVDVLTSSGNQNE
ncbi:hypothetical protein XbC2_71 [Xanthomonas phage XbC2]|nr:hypothetical protein XbC2_71 [Xanthomonas phage XbC2]